MMWDSNTLIERIGLGAYSGIRKGHRNTPIVIGKIEVDPASRGMIAVLSVTQRDSDENIESTQIKYWYRRPNGQSRLINLFDIKVSVKNGQADIEDIFYKNKSLIVGLDRRNFISYREIILNSFHEINLHLREGGSPKEILKILHETNLPDIIQENIKLPGINAEGKFFFPVSDYFNAAARGDLNVPDDAHLQDVIAFGEINTLDPHRSIKTDRVLFSTNSSTGTTFRSNFKVKKRKNVMRVKGEIDPFIVPNGENARDLKDFLLMDWIRKAKDGNQKNEGTFDLNKMVLLNRDLAKEDFDIQIRGLGIYYKIMDMVRRKRFPKVMDFVHLYDYLKHVRLGNLPPQEGRFTLTSYLGNGKGEVVEGFGNDLGACKVLAVEYYNENEELAEENIILDVGILLPPKDSDWDGAVPDIIERLGNCKGIFISHRHLDHMAAIVQLARLGVLKNIPIHGSKRALYILEQQMKADISDKNILPPLKALEGEGIIHFDRISIEYSMDAMEHSTPASAYRVIARKNNKIENLTKEDVYASYFFYGDGRKWQKPEFAARGMKSFGIERQDTLVDIDITNAKKPGRSPTEEDATQNRLDLINLFADQGIILGMISTNDTKLNTYYELFNHTQRNFTSVGHNIEMTLRSHNKFGVDPEYKEVWGKDNINEHLAKHALEETQKHTAQLWEAYNKEADEENKRKIYQEIQEATLLPVEYRGRGSNKAHEWLQKPNKMAILATGTQGNPAELYSTIQKFADGVSVLDADRHTALKIKSPSQWVAIIDQTAIPGNDAHQAAMIHKLITNKKLHAVIVAIEDGYKIYGIKAGSEQDRILQSLRDKNIAAFVSDGSEIVAPGVPIHVSGHAYQQDLADITAEVQADISHGTHSNNPANTAAFHLDICQPRGLRHTERQFSNHEMIAIDMGKSSKDASVKSLGTSHSSIILYKLIRKFGDFFGGTIEAKRVTVLDGQSGYSEIGLTSAGTNSEFEKGIVAVDFARVNKTSRRRARNRMMPLPAETIPPTPIRRFAGVIRPSNSNTPNRNAIRRWASGRKIA